MSGLRARVGIHSRGLWQHRAILTTLLDAELVRARPWAHADFIAGWGHKETTRAARRDAARRKIPYVSLEDGFLRSVRPGPSEPAIGWILDRSGIYYDASAPGDLRAAIIARAALTIETDIVRANHARRFIASHRLSKYNHAPMLGTGDLRLPRGRDIVLVVDQTFGDASVAGARADADTFARMLSAAIDEHPDREIVVKVHPETASGVKRGYLTEPRRRERVHVVSALVNPWSLIEAAKSVYTVSSQLGFEALLAGRHVVCFGQSMYAGLGLTDDRFPAPPAPRTHVSISLNALTAAAYFDYCRWIDPYSQKLTTFEDAAETLVFLRDRYLSNRLSVCIGFSRWKQRSMRDFLRGIDGEPIFRRRTTGAIERSRQLRQTVVWGSHPLPSAEGGHETPIVRCEDGFLRSVGLGAAFVRPMSLVFDDVGLYYDATRPSRFERLAEETHFTPALLERARGLRDSILSHGLSKYNDATALASPRTTNGKQRILVPGQVEDDQSIVLGAKAIRTNLALLRAVRSGSPDAHIVYKPHPDVAAGLRDGQLSADIVRGLADEVVSNVSVTSLLQTVDHVETITSLVGFEALLRGIPVTTHGLPFYAGWGLTDDRVVCERRQRHLTLDELTAIALILYPRYVDPVTRLPCGPEIVVGRLVEARGRRQTLVEKATRASMYQYAWLARRLIKPLMDRLP
jgi:capsular polysaccharide export protein